MPLALIQLVDRFWLPLTLLLLSLITLLSLWPLTHLPTVPGSDKTHHLVAYAMLMLPAALARPRGWILLALFYLGWSGAIELLQPYVNRYGEWLDMLANGCGIALGILLAFFIRFLRR